MTTPSSHHLRQNLESLAAEIVSYSVATGGSSSLVFNPDDLPNLPMANEQIQALLNPWLASYGFRLEVSAQTLMTMPLRG